MSYSIIAYAVDAEKIKRIWNSKDESILEDLITEFNNELLDFDGWFELENPANSSAVLTDIINGQIKHPDLKYLYGYIYELLCMKYGKRIEPHDSEIYLQYLDEVDSTYSAFIPIPFSDDFPHVLSIANDDLEMEREKFLTTKINGYNEEDMEVYINDFKEIFNYAIDNEKDLVLFNY